jgi:hypothetical protein
LALLFLHTLRLELQASYPQWYSRNLDMIMAAALKYKVNMAHMPRSVGYKGTKSVVCHANQCHVDCTSSLGKIILLLMVAQGRSCKVHSQKKALLLLENFCKLATAFTVKLLRDDDEFLLSVGAEGNVDLGQLHRILDKARFRRRPVATSLFVVLIGNCRFHFGASR